MTAAVHYPYTNKEPLAPFAAAAAITKSDTVPLTYISRGVYVGGAGDLDVIMADGSEVVFKAVPAGTLLPIQISQLMSTNTTATLCLALY